MIWFPQTAAGSVTQFPLRRTRKWRAISSRLESGERIVLPDTGAGRIEWSLKYAELSDSEAEKLSDLFALSRGSFGAFTFIDPMANLLGWSEDFSRPDWQTGLLVKAGAVTDPRGTQRAWSFANGSGGEQQIMQTLGIPGEYLACLSAWVRSAAAVMVGLQRDSTRSQVTAGPAWKRVYLSAAGTNGAAQSSFSIVIPSGRTIELWGMQVEAQPYPSLYKPTGTAAGIYQETFFGADELTITSTGVGLSACGIKLVSRV